MSPSLDPIVWARRLHEWGSEDPAFDLLMALGPAVVLALAVGGRNAGTVALATVYVLGFLVALAWNAADPKRG